VRLFAESEPAAGFAEGFGGEVGSNPASVTATAMSKGHSMSSGQEESKTHRDAKSHCLDTHEHLTSYDSISGQTVGRSLDFISNETGREVHSSG
jgi:hypothetical protein